MKEQTRLEKIQNILLEYEEGAFRLKQIQHAIYRDNIFSYEDMSTLPKGLRAVLSERLGPVLSLKNVSLVTGKDTQKALFETKDGHKIESVWMNYSPEESLPRESLCVSSQSGCALGCKFCYTGTMGFKKNLSADEITDQVLFYRKEKGFQGSVSFMGMGEPFSNIENVFEAFAQLNNPDMFHLGERKINVSTVGVITGIQRLTKEFPQANLAFSLHTPFNEEREKIMPITKAYPIEDVMNALDVHIKTTHRKVFLSYIMLKGTNDSPEHAKALAALIKQRKSLNHLYHVNLIRFHGGSAGVPFTCSDESSIKRFISILENHEIHCSLRQSFGLDIRAACGQLCVE